MKKRLVLWGTTPESDRVLVAIGFEEDDNTINTYIFSENVATEEFANQMMNLWREGNEVPFPDAQQQLEFNIIEADRLIPEGVTTERDDLIDKAKAEWTFLYMSNKLAAVYATELEDLSEKIENARRYEQSQWDELRNYWNKVQQQFQEKNLVLPHYKRLKKSVNNLFDQLKAMRKEMDDLLRKDSGVKRDEFFSKLAEIEKKVEEGMGLKPLFEDLKLIQRDFQKAKMVRDHKNKVWKKLDGLFKDIKKKKFGDSAVKSGGSKLQRRYDGLLNAMKKMENSINRDKKDLSFQDKRIESSTAGQLEAQIRKAKIKMIEERMRSKLVKLEEMQKLKDQLESRLEEEKEKEAKRAAEAEVARKKEEAKKKIEEEMKAAEADRKEEEDKLKKAAEKLGASKPESKKKSEEGTSSSGGTASAETVASIAAVSEIIGKSSTEEEE